MKKLLILTLALIMLLSLSVSPALALQTSDLVSAMTVDPGNVRWDDPEYNYAWLDNMIIRDDDMAATQAHIIPKPTDYPYSHTYDMFIKESGNYTKLVTYDIESASAAYEEIINVVYYYVVAMGMTDDVDVMKQYLVQQGIRLPANTSSGEKAQVAVVYAAIKYDALYTLYGKKVSFPVGTTLDGAIVTIISALMGVEVPSGVESISGFILLCTKNYVASFDDIPLSDNPSEAEVFHWAKVILAASSGDYQVPIEVYTETTPAQREYVDYAYSASIISDIYNVKIDPIKLIVAMQDGDPLSVQKLILHTMLDEKNVNYTKDMGCQALFDLACKNGCFNLEEEFYTDVMKYEIEVAQDREKIWFTPFPLAGVLEGSSEEYLSITLNGNSVAPSSTTAIVLDPALKSETVILEAYYNAPDNQDVAVYEFKIVKNPALNGERNPEIKNDLVAEVEQYVNAIVPSDSEKAQQIIGGIFQSVDSAVQNNSLGAQVGEGILTTYGTNVTESLGGVNATVNATVNTTSGFDFAYLDDLLNGVYETDENGNIITTTAFDYEQNTSEKGSFVEKTVQAVKENPEIIAAPTGLIAVGAFAGYLLTKKHRDSEAYLNSEEETEE
ncbi:MAG: hypothetical protein J6Q79_00060 [Clostridia bacterium]|nr:hypothetical protein [Clostridia bacterium]